MMTFWQYLCDAPITLVACFVFGIIFGLFSSIYEDYNWKERLGHVSVSVMLWMFVSFPVVSWIDYTKYKSHYVTCEKPVAKRAGYIFAENRCWKPVASYIKVDETTKSKQELLNEQ